MLRIIVGLCFCVVFTVALDNGLARTPPMGWMSWERFRCNVNCKDDPDNCISQKLFTDMADRMAADGYKEAGYEYIIIDDCWMARERDSKGRLQADPERFPKGIKWLANYIHSKGLKFGIYEDFGTYTCGGYPGSEYYLETDARTFAEWDVDYLKLDGCYSNPNQFSDAYPMMEFWLNMTGRPILYSCSWPAYQEPATKPDYERIAKFCNIWRNYDDIQDSWKSVQTIIDFFGKDEHDFVKYAKPGSFNDPDMLIIGNFGLSDDQQKSQMALWSIMAAPLIMSNDLRDIKPFSKSLLLNKGAIAINQDVLGIQGRRISKEKNHIEIWTKPIYPTGDLAFVIFNNGDEIPKNIKVDFKNLGLNSTNHYLIKEVFDGDFTVMIGPHDNFTVRVNPSGVFFGRAHKLPY